MANASNYKKSTKGKNLTNLPADSTSNKSVKRVYRKASATPKTKTGANKSAIMTLSRQVKSLQNQRFGEIQSASTVFTLDSALKLPEPKLPVCFMVNDFYNDAPVWKGVHYPVSGDVGYSQIAVTERPSYNSDLLDQYEWNARQNTDAVSEIEYKPVYRRMNFHIETNLSGAYAPMKFRITLFKLKPVQLATNQIDCQLPSRLGAYRYLADSNNQIKQNSFNPRFHTVIYDKWVTIKSDSTSPTKSTFVSIPYKFGDTDLVKPDFTNLPTGQTFWTNVPQNDIVWAMISVSGNATHPIVSKITCKSFFSWRDKHGIQG
jgi:hypothetical protein